MGTTNVTNGDSMVTSFEALMQVRLCRQSLALRVYLEGIAYYYNAR